MVELCARLRGFHSSMSERADRQPHPAVYLWTTHTQHQEDNIRGVKCEVQEHKL